MSERPNKQRRVGPHPFLDIEASIGQEDSENDLENDDGRTFLFSLSLQTLNYVLPDDIGVDDDDAEDLHDSRSTHRSLAQAMEDAQRSDEWDSFLQRAEHRGRKDTYTANGEEEEDRAPKEGEYLWEIGCRVR